MLNKLKELFKSKKAQKDGEQKERQPIGALNIVGIVICVLLVPVLIVNCTLIIQSMIHEDEVPSFGKYIPLIVLTESMEPAIMSGDLIICQKADAEDLDVGDVISYFDPKSSASAVVTHRISEKRVEDGKIIFRTEGDNNDIADNWDVPAENLIGKWNEGARIPFVGSIILFMQSTLGLIVCVLLPVAALILVEVLRRRKSDNKKQGDIDALKAELEALKAAQGQKETAPEAVKAEEEKVEAAIEEKSEQTSNTDA